MRNRIKGKALNCYWRVPEWLYDKIEELRERMQARTPWQVVAQADAARRALALGIEVAMREEGEERKESQ